MKGAQTVHPQAKQREALAAIGHQVPGELISDIMIEYPLLCTKLWGRSLNPELATKQFS